MKHVVVTGATSGIGEATALHLAAHGFRVIGTARSAEKAEKLRARAAERGCALTTVLMELTDPDSCRDGFAEITDLTQGGPWALVNNAGVAPVGAFEDVSDATARATLEVNLLATARLTRLVLPGMRRRGSGRIVNMSSLGGIVAMPLNSWYAASKFALEALTDSLRMETSACGIRYSLIEPGLIDTPMVTNALAGLPPQSRYAHSYAVLRRLGPAAPTRTADVVARTVRRALEARRPRRRYRIGLETPLAHLARITPAAVTDRVLRAAVRLDHSAHQPDPQNTSAHTSGAPRNR
ncbi:SDR family NAD(P)-dependent oxidoreductase [Streptomyces sp. NPDC086081]|uniref:SDR family NAD(P)-dependent oxidoreductase n=1 Tax=Streptomyces sp. NPDC086081 TaxID=3365749 RepID=UPI0037FCCAB1